MKNTKKNWLQRGGLVLVLMVAALGLSQLACSPARLDLALYYPAGENGKTVYNAINRFNIVMRGESLTAPEGDDSNEFEPSENKGKILPDVRCEPSKGGGTPKVEIEVVGINGQDKAFASGRSVLFHECGKPLKLSLFMSPVGQFSTLTSFFNSGKGEPFTEAAVMSEKRAGHRMARLPDGRILITGGAEITALGKIASVSGSTEIYDPKTGTFVQGPTMSTARAFHAMTVVENSLVVSGGVGLESGKLTSVRNVDIFALNSEGVLVRRDGPSLTEGRAFHTVSVIGTTSNILVFGGIKFQATSGAPTMATQWEIIDYTKDEVVNKGPIDAANRRFWHSASRLEATGRILIVGGLQITSQGQVNTLDTLVSVFMITENDLPRAVPEASQIKLQAPRAAHTATVLENKSILIAGGMVARANNLFVPQSVVGSLEVFGADGSKKGGLINMVQGRVFHSAQRLTDGRVVIFGGLRGVNSNQAASAANLAEIYSPDSSDGIRPTAQQVKQRKDRFMQSAIILLNGSMAVIGGVALPATPTEPFATLDRGEIFNPGPRAN